MADFKVDSHQPEKLSGIPWPVCRHCGLVWLRNELTAWCVRQGCNNAEHPEFKNACKRLVREDFG